MASPSDRSGIRGGLGSEALIGRRMCYRLVPFGRTPTSTRTIRSGQVLRDGRAEAGVVDGRAALRLNQGVVSAAALTVWGAQCQRSM
jgi:hypothetical protein